MTRFSLPWIPLPQFLAYVKAFVRPVHVCLSRFYLNFIFIISNFWCWVCWTWCMGFDSFDHCILCFLQLKVFSKFTKKNVNYGTMCNGPRPEVLMKLLPIWLDKLVLLERSLLRIQPLRAERPLRRLSWGTNSKYCEWWMGLTLLTIFQRPVLEFDLLYNDRKTFCPIFWKNWEHQ